MIDYSNITAIVKRLKHTYGDLSPDALCEALQIGVKLWTPSALERAFPAFVLKTNRCYTMVINDTLPVLAKRDLKLHEVGHIECKHFDRLGVNLYNETNMYEASLAEIEANCFAAEYLMNTDEIMELIREGRTLENISAEMNVSPEIVDFKFRMLKYYRLIGPNYVARYGSNCMGKINCGKSYEDYYD